MIPRQIPGQKAIAAIQAKIRISLEKRAIVQWRHILIAITGKALTGTVCRNNGIDVNTTAAAIQGAMSTDHRI